MLYAECGGFMYLSEGIAGDDLGVLPMAGVFPVTARMQKKRAGLGYREVRLEADCFFGPAGTLLRGHEFHYSVIDEMPPGRTPIKTYFVTENKRKGAYEFMREKIKEGRQIYVVCPLVEESEKTDLKAAMEEAERLQEDIFPEFKVGLMHGRIKSEEKDAIMKQFAAGKIHILVSTTVIEVGIDVANATVMVIEHAERFGLAQLHQLRGRIGRGSEQSFCFLIGALKSPEAKTRIKAMLDSTDGFKIAEVDLQLRGPGDFYGTKQSGLPDFRAADIVRDELILREAREAAFTLLKEDPELKKDEHAKIKKMMVDRYGKFLGY